MGWPENNNSRAINSRIGRRPRLWRGSVTWSARSLRPLRSAQSSPSCPVGEGNLLNINAAVPAEALPPRLRIPRDLKGHSGPEADSLERIHHRVVRLLRWREDLAPPRVRARPAVIRLRQHAGSLTRPRHNQDATLCHIQHICPPQPAISQIAIEFEFVKASRVSGKL
jgi:hypothetical protein